MLSVYMRLPLKIHIVHVLQYTFIFFISLLTVLKGTDLPGLDTSGLSDPYVETSLQPHVLFEESRIQRTAVVKNTLNPTFNTIFQL